MIVPRRADPDDVITAYTEAWYRFVAYRRALANAGPDPDESWFALLELEMALDWWRQRFVDALGRRGMTVDDALGQAA